MNFERLFVISQKQPGATEMLPEEIANLAAAATTRLGEVTAFLSQTR
jgi:hypothetical protein